jgi:hypothetical protein
VLGRALQGCGDLLRAGQLEHAALLVERVALARDPLRPAFRACLACRLSCRPFRAGDFLRSAMVNSLLSRLKSTGGRCGS